jgi:hypothetical protein
MEHWCLKFVMDAVADVRTKGAARQEDLLGSGDFFQKSFIGFGFTVYHGKPP